MNEELVYCVQVLNDGILPKHNEIQELNFTASELMKDCTAEQAAVIREPLADVNRRWDTLHQNIARKMVCFINPYDRKFSQPCVRASRNSLYSVLG